MVKGINAQFDPPFRSLTTLHAIVHICFYSLRMIVRDPCIEEKCSFIRMLSAINELFLK